MMAHEWPILKDDLPIKSHEDAATYAEWPILKNDLAHDLL